MLLDVAGVTIDLRTADGARRVVNNLSFTLQEGESLGIVGESGSGKTMTALALMGLLARGARVGGTITFEGRDLLRLDEQDMQGVRGNRMAMIFQEPMSALNPLHAIARQVAEPLTLHRGLSSKAARREALRLLEKVRLRDANARANSYPFELSGGERQRVMIAMALACAPSLLIADEPTTALDVTVQAHILDLLQDLSANAKMAMLLVSHDLAVIAQSCTRVLVMYGGEIMESGAVSTVLSAPAHPYTKALLAARPQAGAKRGQRLIAIAGNANETVASGGCPFAGRCGEVRAVCHLAPPPVITMANDHQARCHRLDSAGRLI